MVKKHIINLYIWLYNTKAMEVTKSIGNIVVYTDPASLY
jgi:hypothetical protein